MQIKLLKPIIYAQNRLHSREARSVCTVFSVDGDVWRSYFISLLERNFTQHYTEWMSLITSMAINWPCFSRLCFLDTATSRVDEKSQHATPPTYAALLSAAAACQKLRRRRRDRRGVGVQYTYTRFRPVPKSMTLDDLEGSLCTLFQNTCATMSLLFIYF